jgi:hypothetical protein
MHKMAAALHLIVRSAEAAERLIKNPHRDAFKGCFGTLRALFKSRVSK